MIYWEDEPTDIPPPTKLTLPKSVKQEIRLTVSKQATNHKPGKLAKRASFYQRLKTARANVLRWKPELTAMLPMNRNGAEGSLELTVQPMTQHIKHLPILAQFALPQENEQ